MSRNALCRRRTHSVRQGLSPRSESSKKPVQRHVAAAHEVGPAVEDRAAGRRIEAETPHAEAGRKHVGFSARLQFVEERILRRPQVAVANRYRGLPLPLGAVADGGDLAVALAHNLAARRLANRKMQLREQRRGRIMGPGPNKNRLLRNDRAPPERAGCAASRSGSIRPNRRSRACRASSHSPSPRERTSAPNLERRRRG